MTKTMQRVAGLIFGVAFGFWLSWTGFTSYDVIQGALLLREAYLWLMFPAAVAAAGAGIWLLRLAGARTLAGPPVAWTAVGVRRDHLAGGALFGLGWALAGTCPGPAIAQLGQGRVVALFTVAGIFLGVALRGRLLAPSSAGAASTEAATPAGTCSQ